MWEDFSMGEANFPHRGYWISQHYLKNNQKLNINKLFNLKVRSNIKTYNEQKLFCI